MKLICQILSGSRLYELDTISSDYDYTGVFLNTKHAEIIGLDRFDFYEKKDKDGELSLFEFRHFLSLLKNTNTTVIELLFANNFLLIENEFKKVQEKKYELIDSIKLYNSLKGYIESEKSCAVGKKKNQGEMRKFYISEYGFSPKNFSHLFRLCYCGIYFFENDIFPLNIKEFDKEVHDFIFSVKNQPKKHRKENLLKESEIYINKLDESFKNRKNTYKYNYNLANDLCLNFYNQFLF